MPDQDNAHYESAAKDYLTFFCDELTTRRTGTDQNRQATDFFADTLSGYGFQLEKMGFDCLDWISGSASLQVGGQSLELQISPYSLGIDVKAPIVHTANLEQLEVAEVHGKALLLSGELTKEQLMPKNFPFYNPGHHQHLIKLLENKQPAVIIAATGKDPQMAGGVYPFPLFEDGDFKIPSAYIKDSEGEHLAAHEDQIASVNIEARRLPATGCNVIARKSGSRKPKLVICAHIDAKEGTPGALDNASGVITLLLLAQRLRNYQGQHELEIVAFNGEDYYAASGEIQYLAKTRVTPEDILLAINIDGAGYIDGSTAYSMYNCPEDLQVTLRSIFEKHDSLSPGREWYQSDHSIFIQKDVPAVAFTSDHFDSLWSEIAHTPADRPELVSTEKLVKLSQVIEELISAINARNLNTGER
jgi:aminopeptidase YwaD